MFAANRKNKKLTLISEYFGFFFSITYANFVHSI